MPIIVSPVVPIQPVAGLAHLLCTLTSTLPKVWAISYRFRDATTLVKTEFYRSEPVDFSQDKLVIPAAMTEG